MESKRQKKFASLLQKELGEIFQRESKSLFNGTFITVTYVKMTPDLGLARVYLSFLLTNDKEKTLQNIESHSSQIRGALGKRIGKQVRKVPALEFYIDTMQDEIDRVEKLFENLNNPPANDDEKTD